MLGETGQQQRPERLSLQPAGTVTFLVGEDGVEAFESPPEAVAAALARGGTRLALHTGDAHLRDDGRYAGPVLRRAERLREIANDGQALLTARTAELVDDALPAGASVRDLGLHRLRDLSNPERVFELRAGDDGGASPPLRSLDASPNNLPVQLTTFVGRDAELAAIADLLARERLVTMHGVGGSGKTRLAAQVAAERAGRMRDGAWWVELDAVTDPASVAEVVAAELRVLVEPVQGPLRSLAVGLRDRQLLLCLDNCEHLLDAVAEVAGALLRGCPEVTLLATSREPLGVPGETVWRIPTLAGEEALSLFLERAAQARPWFTLDPSSEEAIRTICARLDGMPLALELAAAWLRTLTPREIEAGLDDRFALLVRGPRGVPARRQTLAASMDWSHDLLDDVHRAVFRRLGAFAGGFTPDGARAVCAGGIVDGDAVLGALALLVDKSLVLAEERHGRARCRLLETVRQYAADRLGEAGETAAARDRHLDHCLALVEDADPELERDKDTWRARLEDEQENLRAALEWGLAADDAERGRRLAAGLPWLWHLNGRGHEGLAFLERAIRRAPEDRTRLQARLLTGVALVADTADPLDLEFDAAQRALELATELGDERLRGLGLALAAVGQFYTDFDAAWEIAAEAMSAAAAGGGSLAVDASPALQAIILHLRDEHAAAQPRLEEAATRLLRRGDRGVAATVVGFRASGALATGALEQARELAEEAVAIAAPLGDYLRVGSTRAVLALVHGTAGDPDAGLEVMEPVVRLVESAGGDVFVPGMGRALGQLQLWRGDPAEAVRWLEPESRSTDRDAATYIAALALPPLGAALRRLGRDEEAAAALERGAEVARRLGMPGVLAAALEGQARLAGDPDAAADLHHEALALRAARGLRPGSLDSLDALAALAGPGDYAVRLLAASGRAREELGLPRRAAPDELVAELRGALGEGPFDEAWRAGAGLALDEAIAYARRSRGARRRPPGGWASLTPTELDVVRLAAEGRNNPEIGARLFMSRSTVKTHLSHVYAKLGVANRTELAALASTHLADEP